MPTETNPAALTGPSDLDALSIGSEITVNFAHGAVWYIKSSRGWTNSFSAHSGGVLGTATVRPGDVLTSSDFANSFAIGTVNHTDTFTTLDGSCA